MDKQFWIEKWHANEIGFHQEDINPYLQTWWEKLQINPGGTVFVPLCGKSRDMLWLLKQGYKVIGVEISQQAVESFFEENQLPVEISEEQRFTRYDAEELTILCGDFFDLSINDLRMISAIYDRAALIALPPEMRQKYVQQLWKILPQTPETLLITLEYPQHEIQGPPFSVTEEEIEDLLGNHHQVACLSTSNVLDDNPRFIERGLSSMTEKVYHLIPI